jgi:hypothetical protein
MTRTQLADLQHIDIVYNLNTNAISSRIRSSSVATCTSTPAALAASRSARARARGSHEHAFLERGFEFLKQYVTQCMVMRRSTTTSIHGCSSFSSRWGEQLVLQTTNGESQVRDSWFTVSSHLCSASIMYCTAILNCCLSNARCDGSAAAASRVASE